MKINKHFILNNPTVVCCGAAAVGMLFPFTSVKSKVEASGFGASVSGSGSSESYNGFAILQHGGFFGVLILLCLVLIAASAFVPKLAPYRKKIALGGSAVGLISLIIVPNIIKKAASGSSNVGGFANVEVKTSAVPLFGFWIMLLAFVAMIVISAVQLFGLKGNKVFDMINGHNDPTETADISNINADKIKEMAQNAAGKVSNAAVNSRIRSLRERRT